MKEDELSIVFDNGVNTFFKFSEKKASTPNAVLCDGKETPYRFLGAYLVINKICEKSQIDLLSLIYYRLTIIVFMASDQVSFIVKLFVQYYGNLK